MFTIGSKASIPVVTHGKVFNLIRDFNSPDCDIQYDEGQLVEGQFSALGRAHIHLTGADCTVFLDSYDNEADKVPFVESWLETYLA